MVLIIKDILTFYPTLPFYPDNYKEINKVKKFVNNNNKEINDFIKLTDISSTNAFLPYVKESNKDLLKIVRDIDLYIYFFKYLFNRARPKQIMPNLKVYPSISADTPAFPSGHTMQSLYLAKILSKKYPEKKDLFIKIANKCGEARIYAGLHYPSDHYFGQKLINILPI